MILSYEVTPDQIDNAINLHNGETVRLDLAE